MKDFRREFGPNVVTWFEKEEDRLEHLEEYLAFYQPKHAHINTDLD
jgi:hypothetical protein